MRTPALAIGYAQWCRHRRSFIAAIVIFLMTAAVCPIVFSGARGLSVGILVAASSIPLSFAIGLLLNALLVVEETGNFSSGYAKAMLTLPVRARTLAIWPMVYGSLTAGLLWLATAFVVYWPLGFRPPLALPALGLAAFMASVQAIAWLPLAKGWLRELVIVTILFALVSLPVVLFVTVENSRGLIGTLLAGYILAAFGVGYCAVASIRRGEVWPLGPSLRWKASRAVRAKSARARRPFKSAAQAQFWYEWNCHGWIYPAYMGLIYFLVLGLMVWRGAIAGMFLFGWVFSLLISLPVIIAAATGPTLGRTRPFWIKDSGSITFLATRPVTSSGLVAPKFQMAFVSALLTWTIVLISLGFWILVSGNLDNARELTRIVVAQLAGWRGLAIVAATFILLPAMTWRQLSDSFPFVLTGRRWILEGSVLAGVMLVSGLALGGVWLFRHPEDMALVLAATPWFAAGLGLLKVALATGTFHLALRRGLVSWQAVGCSLVTWLILSAAGMVVASLVLPSNAVAVFSPVLFITIAVFMPISRFPLSILAVEWNRHR
ncbi:MAG: hypothetical protein ACLQIB_17615 [Isosphaeraceae bacterium]